MDGIASSLNRNFLSFLPSLSLSLILLFHHIRCKVNSKSFLSPFFDSCFSHSSYGFFFLLLVWFFFFFSLSSLPPFSMIPFPPLSFFLGLVFHWVNNHPWTPERHRVSEREVKKWRERGRKRMIHPSKGLPSFGTHTNAGMVFYTISHKRES